MTRWTAAWAFIMLALALSGNPAAGGTETIVRQQLDAGRIQFSGMDINGDGVPDSIRLDNIKRTLAYFVGDARKNLHLFDPATLSEEDRRFVPDVLIETDLDGDEIKDLLLYNREYLLKYRANEPVFQRLLEGSIFIGQPGGTFVALAASRLEEEARMLVLDRARALLAEQPPK